LNDIFPELVLTENTITTVTLAPPTQTLIFAPTSTALPIASLTLAPTASLTSIPTVSPMPVPTKTASAISNKLLIIAIFVITIGAGILIYGWKLRSQ
jgi:hypothetical protein